MKDLSALHQELDANIPRSAVKQREGANRQSFSYLSTDYVIARMNALFGNLNWSTSTEEVRLVHTGTTTYFDKFKKCDVTKHNAHYVARVKVEAQHIDENGRVIRTSHMGTGYGDGSDTTNPGKAHELAAKEAESDALKRACKNFGQSMGLALYDKDQTNVDDDKAPAPVAGPRPLAAAPAIAAARPSSPEPARPALAEAKPISNRETLNKSINTLSKIVNGKGAKSFEAIKADMVNKYGTDKKEALTDAQAAELKAELEKLAG